VISHLSKEGEEEKTIHELKEMAKWSRSQQEMKTAINELAARGEIALPVLEEILNVTAHEDIKATCIEAIKAVKGKKEREEEKEDDDEEEKGTVKKTKSEAQVVVEKEGEKGAATTAGKTETAARAS
jgi:hypothetical protein